MTKIELNEKVVPFACNGATPLTYRARFGSDFFGDIAKVDHGMSDMQLMDTTKLCQIIYHLAKTADATIPDDMVAWFASMNEFPLISVYTLVAAEISKCMLAEKKG